MRRREFITLLGGAAAVAARRAGAAARPHAAHRGASAPRRGRCGWPGPHGAFRQGLEMGVERRPQSADRDRWAAGNADVSASTPKNWSRWTQTSSWPPAVRPLTATARDPRVPIVFVNIPDPVGAGFVESLARPGGNATGFTTFEYGMSGKWLELLKEIAPNRLERRCCAMPPSPPGLASRVRSRGGAALGAEVGPLNVRCAEIERASRHSRAPPTAA